MTSRYPNRHWCIITREEIESLPVDFSKVMENSAETLRYSLDGTKTFVKYEGEQPDFLNGKTELNHNEILQILSTSEWSIMENIDVSVNDESNIFVNDESNVSVNDESNI
jgi:hypothetical protein